MSAGRAAIAATALLALGCAAAAPQPEPAAGARRISDGRPAMGTILEIELVGADPAALRAELDALYAEVESLEAALSTWRADSELSRLNRAAGGAAVALAPPALALLERSLALARETGGRFDVTVGPLVDLWRNAAVLGRWPRAAEVATARALVGPGQLRIAADGSAALASAGARVEVGGVAKGFALDRLARRLRARGIESALLDFGGSSIQALGAAPGAAGWRLLARDAQGAPLGVLTLRDQALSVSGSLGQSAEIAGRRIGHVIDPRSGEPLERALQAIAIAGDGTLAEACSKAYLIAAGDPGGFAQLAQSLPGCAAQLAGDGEILFQSERFDAESRFERLKPPRPDADPNAVSSDLPCPVCSADIDTSGARVGEEVFCSYCGAPARLVRVVKGDEQAEFDLEEEY